MKNQIYAKTQCGEPDINPCAILTMTDVFFFNSVNLNCQVKGQNSELTLYMELVKKALKSFNPRQSNMSWVAGRNSLTSTSFSTIAAFMQVSLEHFLPPHIMGLKVLTFCTKLTMLIPRMKIFSIDSIPL